MEVHINQEFFPSFLTTRKEDKDHNQGVDLEGHGECLANFQVDKIDHYKIDEKTDSKL